MMSNYRVHIEVVEYYDFYIEIEAETEDEALQKAECVQAKEPIQYMKDTYSGCSVDYIATKIDQ